VINEKSGKAGRAATEQAPEKLFPLIRRINDLLGAKEKRLVATSTAIP
jgi:hypothetical protein